MFEFLQQLSPSGKPGPLATLLSSVTPDSLKPSYRFTHWVPGSTPLSTNTEVVTAIATYLVIIFGGRELMRNRAPFKLQFLFRVHNFLLSAGSAILLALMLEEIVPIFAKNGPFYSICNTRAFTPRLVSYYIINYYFKYVELIDTLFLVLKKKKLAFLHVFHHAATAVLCFNQLEGKTSVQWVVITLNLFVHVIMYYYYYATAGGAKIWWKKYLTTLQITQFVIDLFVTYFASYTHFAMVRFPFLPNMGDCAGSESAALFGTGLLTSYLFLFIAFYRATYKKAAGDKANKGKRAVAEAAGDIRGSANSKVIRQDSRGVAVITEISDE
ncbi:Fatty acyl-CoA elongase/Polyunsaturated fatty acid specific elongation enzyme [Naganishia albida]|nr:Fatty acyl-CoA elongase/Polyunsaturated fatty acid specific elongation enzyme [Naganishia albida]